MSGGVDSSVTAALLAEGYDVVGITLQLYDQGAATKKGACCAGPGHPRCPRTSPNGSAFRITCSTTKTVSASGDRAISPTPMCAARRRFPASDATSGQIRAICSTTARELGADAAGDRPLCAPRRLAGRRGDASRRDAARDQSYFLFATTREQLDLLRFPLGAMERPRSGRWRAAYGLPSRTSRTARTSVSCPTATMRRWWRSCGPARHDPARSSISKAGCSAAMTASSISPSASERASACRHMASRFSC